MLDTHVLLFDALQPGRLSARARKAIESGFAGRELACSDISLWEIAMLISRKRVDPGMDAKQFLDDLVVARGVSVLPITPEIAVLSQADYFQHGDPADRLIAASALINGAALVTSDGHLRKIKQLSTIW